MLVGFGTTSSKNTNNNIYDSLYIENELVEICTDCRTIPVFVFPNTKLVHYPFDTVMKHSILVELPAESTRGHNRVFVLEDQLLDPTDVTNEVALIEEEVT